MFFCDAAFLRCSDGWAERFVQQKYFKLFFGFIQKLELSGENIHRIIGRILGYVVPKTCMLLYFGNRTGHVLKEDRYLLKILLVACKKKSDDKEVVQTRSTYT